MSETTGVSSLKPDNLRHYKPTYTTILFHLYLIVMIMQFVLYSAHSYTLKFHYLMYMNPTNVMIRCNFLWYSKFENHLCIYNIRTKCSKVLISLSGSPLSLVLGNGGAGYSNTADGGVGNFSGVVTLSTEKVE